MNTAETLDLQAAAEFLHIHPETLRERASRRQICGAKVGRRWVFLKDDLVKVIRDGYADGGQTARVEAQQCHSTSAKTPRSGGSKSRSQAISQYRKALGLPTK